MEDFWQDWMWVDGQGAEESLFEAAVRAAAVAIDTEYDSFRYFREKLCLIQICVEKKTYLFDPLQERDLSCLGRIFRDPGILKVLHAGDNDIRILKRDYGFDFANIFDTYRAASLLGCGRLSLAGLVGDVLGVTLEKERKVQRSRWDLRPLTETQIRYAVRDVAFLEPLRRRLEAEIAARGLVAEAERVFGEIAEVTWQERTFDRNGHTRIPGFYDLTARQQRRLEHLYRWRFQRAKGMDRAIFMVLSDSELLRLAAAEATPEAVRGVLSEEKAGRYGRELLAILVNA
ncbi:MAG TPA: ribonuclease D [Syntrophales bacterium]|nr:ribonuclease D [Syntrophales bacterium]HOM07012.1 ribonuclease D [Syntrophales bacterium]HON99589.1 ribonuclease D [Syntrophales bacterium]HPQ06780.1 ribonuclease D [Syntrophales bacterium]HRS86903.1 ribonuclease D [Syntrophales bacterium]